jgi:hypothetical protein
VVPRYFFHFDGVDPAEDTEGTEVTNIAEAQREAAGLIGAALCDEPGAFWKADRYRVTVADERGLILFTVEMICNLAAAMPVRAVPRRVMET